jgi:hypothetical protein
VAFFTVGSASATTITFEEFAENTCVCTGIESGGFRFEEVSGPGTGVVRTVGDSKALQFTTYDAITFSMESTSGESFSLSSLDTTGNAILLTGFYASGGTVQITTSSGKLGHVSAALYHHFVKEDKTLQKMTIEKQYQNML